MKQWVGLVGLAILASGCAPKKPVVKESIPPRCIMGGFVDRTKCVAYEKDPTLAVCDQVLVKYACIEVDK
jgi:hypothetical protein